MAPTFDNRKIMVIYVLGGPGAGKIQLSLFDVWLNETAGKGTQCARLVEDFGFCHLSGMLSCSHAFTISRTLLQLQLETCSEPSSSVKGLNTVN